MVFKYFYALYYPKTMGYNNINYNYGADAPGLWPLAWNFARDWFPRYSFWLIYIHRREIIYFCFNKIQLLCSFRLYRARKNIWNDYKYLFTKLEYDSVNFLSEYCANFNSNVVRLYAKYAILPDRAVNKFEL